MCSMYLRIYQDDIIQPAHKPTLCRGLHSIESKVAHTITRNVLPCYCQLVCRNLRRNVVTSTTNNTATAIFLMGVGVDANAYVNTRCIFKFGGGMQPTKLSRCIVCAGNCAITPGVVRTLLFVTFHTFWARVLRWLQCGCQLCRKRLLAQCPLHLSHMRLRQLEAKLVKILR